MKETFRWNEFADQPHNVFPKKERRKHHLRHAGSYLELAAVNLRRLVPGLALYRRYRKHLYSNPIDIADPFAVSVSPAAEKSDEVIRLLEEAGVKKTLFRIPSWEVENLDDYEHFIRLLAQKGFEITVALLQNRNDVLDHGRWRSYLGEVFGRFSGLVSSYEVGHAWNRTKWGVWDHKEYLGLAEEAFTLAGKHEVRLVGPAVIDFEFHLYPVLLQYLPFDKISSLLYVDRVGAPENTQFGWDISRKLALIRASIDVSGGRNKGLWITEVNWPLKGTGKYSPAAGKPNVSEQEQADYLVRYYLMCLASGFVERIYWWQLAAPGYGLVDSRSESWRPRPSFFALRNLVMRLRDSCFLGQDFHPKARIFNFRSGNQNFAVCWAPGSRHDCVLYSPSRKILKATGRDGEEVPVKNNGVSVHSSPVYLYFTP